MDNQNQKLANLALITAKVLMLNPEKDKRYVEFLAKHKLPNSGPTAELLGSLSKEQREELFKIIM